MGYDKTVKGATKLKVCHMAAPKAKYIEPILQGTANQGELEDIFRCLSSRLRDTAWTVVFKALIVVHIMIREGKRDAALEYLRHHSRILDCSQMNRGNAGRYGDTIQRYSRYLQERVKQYHSLKMDYVRHKKDYPDRGRLRDLSVDKGLLREVEGVQSQLKHLLRCRFSPSEVDDDITLTAFRLLVHDLLSLHQVVNEGMINVLEHYFEMSRFDAERALEMYKLFVDEMEGIVEYLHVARRLEGQTRLSVPNIKHAPTSLTASLEEYLNDPEFDVNRRQFLAAKEAKMAAHRTDVEIPNALTLAQQQQPQQIQQQAATTKKLSPEQSLVDYFASIEQQESVFPESSPQMQQTAPQPVQQPVQQIPPQQGYVYPQSQPTLTQDFTGAGFGGYSAQPQVAMPTAQPYQPFSQPPQMLQLQQTGWGQSLFGSQDSQAPQPSVFDQMQPQRLESQPTGSTNPFRKSTAFTGITPQFTGTTSTSAVSTNPFHKPLQAVPEYETPSPLVSQSTNPFARARQSALVAQGTGSANPFRSGV
ncbi:ANTH domain-containing protein [Lipomyces arxii]|uniref:ANTH domain-containing protein n=1 Tax=Lipomyces arxii TaxID=56418 RepID=UPI0034CD7557